jgi:hypothetical protein
MPGFKGKRKGGLTLPLYKKPFRYRLTAVSPPRNLRSVFVNSPPPKPEVILTNFFAEPTVLLVPITSRAYRTSQIHAMK